MISNPILLLGGTQVKLTNRQTTFVIFRRHNLSVKQYIFFQLGVNFAQTNQHILHFNNSLSIYQTRLLQVYKILLQGFQFCL